jgi:hypothetical protein
MAESPEMDETEMEWNRAPALEEALQRLQRYQPLDSNDTTAVFFETMLMTSPLQHNPHIIAWILSPTLPASWEPSLQSEAQALLEQMVRPQRHFEVQSRGTQETAEAARTVDEVEDELLRERCKW